MFKYIFCLIFFLLSYNSDAQAQSKRDYTWILGGSTAIPGVPTLGVNGGMMLDFHQNPPHLDTFDIYTIGILGIANDEQGNLQFYSSGCNVFNKNHEIMDGGADIFLPGGFNAEWRCDTKTDPYPALLNLWGSTVVLPIPESDSRYLLFQTRMMVPPTSGRSILDTYYYTEIDMAENNGLGKVVKKHQVVIANDSLHDMVSAVRHGNGRDWWIVMPRGTERQFWMIPVTPDGIGTPVLRTLPNQEKFTLLQIINPDVIPPEYGPLDEYMVEQWGGEANFSPDGSKYCRIVPGNGVEIFDFDRCTANMTLRRTIPMPPDSLYIKAKTHIQACGLVVSPNNRYLYFNNNLSMFQFDLSEDSLEHGGYEFIQYFDFHYDPFGSHFFHMRNAPDGKIYGNSSNSVRVMHTIHQPNLKGKDCQFEQHALNFPRYNHSLFPYFPNFRLGKLAGSPCDPTIGTKLPERFDKIEIFPNPADDFVKIRLPFPFDGRVELADVSGKILHGFEAGGREEFSLSTLDLAAGLYFLKLKTAEGFSKTYKFNVVH